MNKLILFDWDDTITGPKDSYKVTNKEFISLINNLQENKGWLIGLNSDTPLKRLQSWTEPLNMKGPIIAEMGQIVWWHSIEPIFKPTLKEKFFDLRKQIINILTDKNIGLFFGDSTEFVKSVTGGLSCHDEVLVILDAYRVCSFGSFVCTVENGRLSRDNKQIWRNIQKLLDDLHLCPDDCEFDLGERYNFLGIREKGAEKSNGLQILINRFPEFYQPESRIIMVGDSINDYIALPESFPKIEHFAVGNAKPEFKNKADFIAQHDFINGCIEILKQFF